MGERREGVLQVAKGMEYYLRAVYEYGSRKRTGTGKYMFNYSASYVYDNVKCGYFNAAEMISKLPSGNVMFFATHAHQSLVARYKATEVVAADGTVTYTCPPGSMETNFGEAAQQVVDGRCTHLKENNYIIPGMEGSTMAFDHSYDTTSGEYSGTKPKTYVQKKDSDVNEYEFAPGQSVQLTMKQWLELAGVDLDKPFDQQPGNFEGTLEGLTGGGADYSGTGTALNSTGKYPYPRLSGVRLNILVRYFNYDLHKKVHTEMGDDDVYAIVTVSPVLGWFSKGQEITYRSNPTDLTDPIDAADGALRRVLPRYVQVWHLVRHSTNRFGRCAGSRLYHFNFDVWFGPVRRRGYHRQSPGQVWLG